MPARKEEKTATKPVKAAESISKASKAQDDSTKKSPAKSSSNA